MFKRCKVVGALTFCLVTVIAPLAKAADERGERTPAAGDATAILERARQVMRVQQDGESVLHQRSFAAEEENYQSDRTYPPFFFAMEVNEEWFAPRGCVDRVSTQTTFPGQGPAPAQEVLSDATRAFRPSGKDSALAPTLFPRARFLNPWAVVCDWIQAGDAQVSGREMYRDYERVVLTRKTAVGVQRLFMDPKTGFPVKLDLEEKHYLWGQRHVEYVYTTWILSGGVMTPGSSIRLADGAVEISQTVSAVEVVPSGKAPSLSMPEGPSLPLDALPRFLQPLEPKVVQVGPATYLLSNPGYTEAVTQIGDEVFLFDATQGEERSRKDAEAIAKLFPKHKRLTVVVTDLAWPHVAGVRYWVANGARIVAHKAAREFLQSVVDRRWTLAPDLLEARRKSLKMDFVGVDTATSLADDAIRLAPIDGIGSEVTLMAYLKAERFLWASDYIQTVAGPSSYASEVWHAAQREGFHPERTAAEHLPLTAWSQIEDLQRQLDAGTGTSSH
jgi:hypothetical protein